MAPIAIAKEKGFFEDEGLYVTLEPQANWKVLLDRVITGELDGAHMLAGQPIGATIGFGTKAHVITPFCDGPQRQRHHRVERRLGGDEEAASRRDRTASPCIRSRPTRSSRWSRNTRPRASPSTWAWCSRSRPTTTNCATGWPPAASIPASIRRPTSSGQIMGDVLISVTPPPQMPATLEAGTIHRLLRRRAVEPAGGVQGHRRAGHHRLRDLEEQSGKGVRRHRRVRREESEHHARHHQGADPRGHVARRRTTTPTARKPSKILSKPEYVGADVRRHRQFDDRHLRIREGRQASGAGLQRLLPLLRDLSLLLAMRSGTSRRCAAGVRLPRAKPDAWYAETAKKVYRPDIYLEAAKLLVAEGKAKKDDFPLGDRRLPRRTRRISSTASAMTAASRTPTSTASRSD